MKNRQTPQECNRSPPMAPLLTHHLLFFLYSCLDSLACRAVQFVRQEHDRRGIDVLHFGELLMTSGLVLLPNVTWISFHSGYDFGYLLKLLTCSNLPAQVRWKNLKYDQLVFCVMKVSATSPAFFNCLLSILVL